MYSKPELTKKSAEIKVSLAKTSSHLIDRESDPVSLSDNYFRSPQESSKNL